MASYAHQIQALVRLGLDDDWLHAVCHDNGARLLGLHTRACDRTYMRLISAMSSRRWRTPPQATGLPSR